MLEIAFGLFVAATAGLVVAVIARWVGRRPAGGVAIALLVWFAYTAALAATGVVQNLTLRPPGPVFLLAPVAVSLLLLLLRPAMTRPIFAAIPLWLLVALQAFRIGVELFLHAMWNRHLIPRMLTYEGANVDIAVGLTAPLIAWVAARFRGRSVRTLVLGWNLLGLVVLGNVVVRALLTAPGPMHRIDAEVPNRLLATYPYLLVPAFFVPLAVVLHVGAIRRCSSLEGRPMIQRS